MFDIAWNQTHDHVLFFLIRDRRRAGQVWAELRQDQRGRSRRTVRNPGAAGFGFHPERNPQHLRRRSGQL